MKKQLIALLLLAALALPLGTSAQGNTRIDGRIEAVRTQTILAPHTGRVEDFSVRAGDALAAGEPLFSLSAQPVYAEFDGTVTGMFAEAGDRTEAVQSRYGALCYMERALLYTAECSISGAHSDNENRIIHVGERVYFRSSATEDRKGEAIVTSVSGKEYTLEILRQEDVRLNEQIKVYRDEDFDSDTCIGTGRVRRIEPEAVTADGYVRGIFAADGDSVSRGDLLFEIVPDALEGMRGSDGTVRMPADGVLLSVLCESGSEIAKDTPMATFCEKQDMQLICAVDEEDLALIEPGMEVAVTLDAYRSEAIAGTVVRIAGASTQTGSAANYDVIISLPADADVRIGMNATAEF